MSYRVNYGPAYTYGRDFESFDVALTFALMHRSAGGAVRVWRPSEVDGAPDSSARAQAGLTKAEWARLEAEGIV